MRLHVIAAIALLALGCGVEQGAPERISRGDAALFADYVQPYVALNCATLDCHGVAGRPLRLYSELGLRDDNALRELPISQTRDPAPITPAELVDNQLSLAGVGAGVPPDSNLALRKPLALSAGGFAHEGGVHWETREDPGYLCLRGYLAGDDGDDVAAACATALAATTR